MPKAVKKLGLQQYMIVMCLISILGGMLFVTNSLGIDDGLIISSEPIKFVGKVVPYFECNRGEFNSTTKYLSRGENYTLRLETTKAILELFDQDGGESTYVTMKFIGASPFTDLMAKDRIPYRIQYSYINAVPSQQKSVTGYRKIVYKSVFPGIDLVFAARPTYIEYYFELHPRAQINEIVIEYDGAQDVMLGGDGELIIQLAEGNLIQPAPTLFQVSDGIRNKIKGGFTLLSHNRVGFHVENYNQMASLVIDPVFLYFKPEKSWGVKTASQVPLNCYIIEDTPKQSGKRVFNLR